MTSAKGYNGTVSFDGNFISITREGALARLSQGRGEKRIPVKHLTAVQIKPAGALTNGFISFTLAGGHEAGGLKGSRTSNAAQDENSVIFLKKQQSDFEALRDEIEAAMIAPVAPTAAAPDLAAQLQQLATLRDQGILTEDEFQAKKADILGRM